VARKPKIRSDFPNVLEKELLEKICNRRGCDRVYVRHFDRFGLSKARLLLIHFNKRPIGVPFLLKVARLRKAKAEYKATTVLANHVQDARFAENRLFEACDPDGTKWGGLLFEHRGTDISETADRPRTLRELIYDPGIPFNRLRGMLNEVFNKLQNAHALSGCREVDLREHYKRYFRKDESRERIQCVLGRDARSDWMTFLDARIYNPLKLLDALPTRVRACMATVHGDLHPDNVIIDRTRVAHLIDFAWARNRQDVLIDFALLENSIRFMAFRPPINFRDQLRVDRLLVHEDPFHEISSLRLSSPTNRERYARLVGAVRVIRERARTLLRRNFSMRHYLTTQFILLYGLLRYDNYELYVGTRALGLIAARLHRDGLLSGG
jgi:Ternary complex associated domain 9